MHNGIQESSRVPDGKHFAVTWSVPVVHGGRTNSMLHRSRAFVAEGGANVEILTFDNFRDYPQIRRTLRQQGKLIEGLTIRNLWEDLPSLAGDAPVLPPEGVSFSPLGAAGIPMTAVEGGPRKRTQRFGPDGTTLLQTDYLREDGTLFLSDRSDVDRSGVVGGRSLTLCNSDGLPVQQWRSSWEMYRSWLDHLTNGHESFFIVDNKHAATIMKTYRRPWATVVLMVHDSHLATASRGPASPLSGAGEVLVPRFDSFDGVTILTHRQAEDVRARVGDVGNLYVIPNSRAASGGPVEADRDPTAGVLLAQLRPLKQIDHAIRAVNDVNHRLRSNASLAIYGEGAEGPKLQGLIDQLGVSSKVQLRGHTHSPARVFSESSFSLLTSSSESFGLVILESMSAGCIPIAYDIHYGPSSIITNGVDGFIVEYGNEAALAECVADFLAMPAGRKAELREAAIRRAADFSDAHVVAMWSKTLTAAAAQKNLPKPEVHVAVTDTAWATWSDGGLDLRVTARLSLDSESLDTNAPTFLCRLRVRGSERFYRVPGAVTGQISEGAFSVAFRFPPEIMRELGDSVVDATLETRVLGSRVASRLPFNVPVPMAMDVYGTVHGNLSLRPVRPPSPEQTQPPSPSPVNEQDVTGNQPLVSPSVLPSGYHCAVTWGIPTEYGGMTNALLHRSRAFINEAGVPVDVLTFEWSADYREVRRRLEAAGELIPGLQLRNLWEELAGLTETQVTSLTSGANVIGEFSAIGGDDEAVEETSGGVLLRRIRYASDRKTVLQIDYFRRDGSLMVADRRDVQARGVEGGRLITLCGLDGCPAASWNQIWPLYLFWLDCVVAGRESFMIIDSKSTANFMTRYRRDNVVTMHLVHNSHMASGALPPHGELSPTRRYVFERLSSFDAVVFLTESQKEDVDLVFDNPPNTCVIPNSRSFPEVTEPENGHTPELGVILGSLTGRKRIDHAIQAVSRAHQSSELGYRLEIYGQGPDQAALSRLIESNGLGSRIELRGYSMDARQEFARASFTLLTSKLEGQGLVLIEAMSAGCIPISYDVPYGPADIIQDGVNGFLVEAGNIQAMAEKIRQLGSMDAEALKDMRRAAVSRAHDFNDGSVVKSWATVMSAAVDRKLLTAPLIPAPS